MAILTAQNSISANIFKTWLIMFFFALFIVGVVFVFAKGYGLPTPDALGLTGFALILAGVMNLISYFFSDRMVLSISGAKRIDQGSNKELFRLVENLCIADGLPTPKIYIIEDNAPNAFATGRDQNHSAICFTSGILQRLNKQELEGVIAHELSHVKNRDTLLMSVVSILVGLISILADWFLRMNYFGGRDDDRESNNAIFFILAIVAAILAPIIATLIQLAISRRREFLADASGAYLTRNPEGLATALQKISSDQDFLHTATSATAHLFIVNPLKGKTMGMWFANLFNTHPPIPDRIKALKAMEGQF